MDRREEDSGEGLLRQVVIYVKVNKGNATLIEKGVVLVYDHHRYSCSAQRSVGNILMDILYHIEPSS